MCVGHLGRLLHLLECGVFDTKTDVVEEGVVEEDGFLVDIADQRTEFRNTERANVVSVDANSAGCDVVEA